MALPTERSLSSSEHLRQVACRLFVERGFQGLSLRELAMKVGVHAGSLYNHMESKQALLFELIEEYESDLLYALRSCKPITVDPYSMLLDYVETVVRFISHHRQGALLARLETRSLEEQQKGVIHSIRREQLACLNAILVQSERIGVFPLHGTSTAHCILLILTSVAEWHLAESELGVNELVDQLQAVVAFTVGFRSAAIS